MNTDFESYMQYFLDSLGIPSDAKKELLDVEHRICSNEDVLKTFSKTKLELMNNNCSLEEALDFINPLSKPLNISEYTLHFVFLVHCTEILLANFKREHIDEQIFWDTMDDFRCKLLECHEVKGVWGTFAAGWYADFLKMKRFALGRFQYEEWPFEGSSYEKNGLVLKNGDRVYNFHIPSSGRRIDKPERMASYRKAYEFYGFHKTGGNIVFVCDSWLLYKGMQNILPQNSNILDFQQDFDIVSSTDNEEFHDIWRVFGKYHKNPLDQLPKDTSLRKAIAEHLQAGGKMGTGFGIIVFDGHNIINK